MKFHDYRDAHSVIGKPIGMELAEFTREAVRVSMDEDRPLSLRLSLGEHAWIKSKRPYYNVWPRITPMLCKLDLAKVQTKQLELPYAALLLRFAESETVGFESVDKWWGLRSVMISYQPSTTGRGKEVGEGICVWSDYGETITREDSMGKITTPVFNFDVFPIRDNMTVQEALDLPHAKHDERDIVTPTPSKEYCDSVLRIVVTVCLLGGDPELLTPDVLSADRDRFEATKDEELMKRLIARAKQRGKFGFDLGRNLEVSPHYRRAHPFLVWTGPKRMVPKIVLRKGSIIHRELVEKVPTGKMPDEVQAESEVSDGSK